MSSTTEKQALKYFKTTALVCFFLLACTKPRTNSAEASGRSFQVTLSKSEVEQGNVFSVRVKTDENAKVKLNGHMNSVALEFFPDGTAGSYKALVGIDDKQPLGDTKVEVEACFEPSNCEKKSTEIKLIEEKFPSETLSVAPRMIDPNKKDQARIAREQVVLNKVYASSERQKFWEAQGMMPIKNDITSIFGTRRVYNGKVTGAHYGTDLRAAVGTPVFTPWSGKVVLSRNLFFTGNTVILDHGYGFFSIYGHLSKLKFKEGVKIAKGKVLGLSGKTGRVSGPHLHWGIKLSGARIDPVKLLKALESE